MPKINIRQELYSKAHGFRKNGSQTEIQGLMPFSFLVPCIFNIKLPIVLFLRDATSPSICKANAAVTSLNCVHSDLGVTASTSSRVLPFAGTTSDFLYQAGTAGQFTGPLCVTEDVVQSSSLKNCFKLIYLAQLYFKPAAQVQFNWESIEVTQH